MKRNKTKAFTLTEMIAVIIILAILALIALFGYRTVIGNAHEISLVTTAAQVAETLKGDIQTHHRAGNTPISDNDIQRAYDNLTSELTPETHKELVVSTAENPDTLEMSLYDGVGNCVYTSTTYANLNKEIVSWSPIQKQQTPPGTHQLRLNSTAEHCGTPATGTSPDPGDTILVDNGGSTPPNGTPDYSNLTQPTYPNTDEHIYFQSSGGTAPEVEASSQTIPFVYYHKIDEYVANHQPMYNALNDAFVQAIAAGNTSTLPSWLPDAVCQPWNLKHLHSNGGIPQNFRSTCDNLTGSEFSLSTPETDGKTNYTTITDTCKYRQIGNETITFFASDSDILNGTDTMGNPLIGSSSFPSDTFTSLYSHTDPAYTPMNTMDDNHKLLLYSLYYNIRTNGNEMSTYGSNTSMISMGAMMGYTGIRCSSTTPAPPIDTGGYTPPGGYVPPDGGGYVPPGGYTPPGGGTTTPPPTSITLSGGNPMGMHELSWTSYPSGSYAVYRLAPGQTDYEQITQTVGVTQYTDYQAGWSGYSPLSEFKYYVVALDTPTNLQSNTISIVRW